MNTPTVLIDANRSPLCDLDRPDFLITLCYYKNGNLERSIRSTRNTRYLAISHSWGEPKWQEIPGVEGEIWVSEERAKFILSRLPSIVGREYFWMDILCVDQYRREAVLRVPNHLPTIYRNAHCTVVIRDPTGFRDCCAQATGDTSSWFIEGEDTARSRLAHHCRTVHQFECLAEGVLSRLWIIQEILLSDNIRFVRDEAEIISSGDEKYFPESDIAQIHRIEALAMAWGDYVCGSTSNFPETHSAFISAFLGSGFASRPPVGAYTCLKSLKNSETVQARASVSKYYDVEHLPQGLLSIPSENAELNIMARVVTDRYPELDTLHGDRCHHSDRLGTRQQQDLTTCVTGSSCHREIMRVLYGARLIMHAENAKPLRDVFSSSSNDEYQISVEDVLNLSSYDTLRHIYQCIWRSAMIWRATNQGELRVFCKHYTKAAKSKSSNSKTRVQDAISIVGQIASNRLSDCFQNQVAEQIEVEAIGPELVLHIAALISCGLGLSAVGWSLRNLKPVLVTFREKLFISLAPISINAGKDQHKFTLVKSKRYSFDKTPSVFVLLAWNLKLGGRSYTLCLFPPDVDVEWEEPEV
jgi:hypothetical protein